MNKKLAAGLAGIAGVAALILASTASDPPGSIVLQGKTVSPRLYRSTMVGDGLTPETAFRPAFADSLVGKAHKYKWDPDTGQSIVWVENHIHTDLAAAHEFLGTPEAGP